MSTMMLIDDKHRALDFQYILWKFDVSGLNMVALERLDKGPGANEEDLEDVDELDTDGNEIPRKKPENIKGSSCCTIF